MLTSRQPARHASTHKHGGTDEVATATPTGNAIPKASPGGTLAVGWLPLMAASGASHAAGAVPDPGSVSGSTRYLREDATWAAAPLMGASGAGHAAGAAPDPGSVSGSTRYLREDATWATPPTNSGTVTSVALTMPAEFSVSGSPVTSSGTLAVAKANQSANQIYAGPGSGAAAAPAFRTLVAADLALGDGQIPESIGGTLTGMPLPNAMFDFRLTTSSGTPVLGSDATSITTLYLTPYLGNRVALYDGTRWKLYSSAELTLALGTLTSGKNYDVFLYDNSGTLTLEAVAWTNDTTRVTALVNQDGVLVKSGATTRRYCGTFRTTSTTTTEDSATRRFLVNWYNRVRRRLFANPGYTDDTLATIWTTTGISFAEANGGTGSKFEFLYLLGDPYDIVLSFVAFNSGTNATLGGIGMDSTLSATVAADIQGTSVGTATCRWSDVPSEGYHYADFLVAVSAGTGSFLADIAPRGSAHDPRASMMTGWIWG